ncbi:GTP-binding protein [Simiduia sp. 21SJ11W-1]|uniref:CobW family GTP-binding protein n=1 Tax=Simiduia sp. 21SJ11W-1 TaxID=2909669 RepID=UPI00209E8200|nr:GTP-binding protein [Simiduia sp. 21SJ11W-1]UTA47731.1 GTP-binding protein [Simiduia sp. 21SJ11W-1]
MKTAQAFEIIQKVPTNIVTGFLGVGKTTAILHLLANKPAHERWAVLVNEFGEVGVDGSLLQGSSQDSVFIKEVPGGCMCCAAGLPMQIALNQLLRKARPHRVIIEPTGLGHPQEVLEVLGHPVYRDTLDVQRCITLVDARKLADERYRNNATFNQQLMVADLIVGHKTDLYTEADQSLLAAYIREHCGPEVPIKFASNGGLLLADLAGPCKVTRAVQAGVSLAPEAPKAREVKPVDLPATGYRVRENTGEGFQSTGWQFGPEVIFDRTRLFSWLSDVGIERAKGVFITEEGVFGYNVADGCLTEVELDDCMDSRVELIYASRTGPDNAKLLACIVGDAPQRVT